MDEMHALGSISAARQQGGRVRTPLRTVRVCVLLLASAGAVSAQQQFEEFLPKRYLPMSNELTTSFAVTDLDADGDVDLLVGNGGGRKEALLLNDGTGIFGDATATHLPAGVISMGDVAHGDVDGDGDPDFLLPSGSSLPTQSRLYVNDGTAHFADESAARLPPTTEESSGALFGDVDGDGDLDLLLYRSDLFKQTGLYLNDGLGTFADVTAAMMPVAFSYGASNHATVGDVDGDGDLDLVQAKYTSEQLYLNDGLGTFAGPQFGNLPGLNTLPSSVAMVDVDGDLDLDIVVGSRSNLRTDALYSNDGTGVFSDASFRLPEAQDQTEAVSIGDVDGDSDPDIVYGNQGRSRVALNDGTGTFVGGPPLPAVGFEETYAVGLADLDGDGDRDLALGGYHQDRLYWNDGAAGFTNATP
jgi:hypothetical protein